MHLLAGGYYGFQNLGDELLLNSLLQRIRSIAPEAEVRILSSHPGQTESLHGIRGIQRWNPIALVQAIRKADGLIFGGGGIFQDLTSSLSLEYYLSWIRLAHFFKKPVLLWGIGVGPILRPANSKKTAQLLRTIRHITVRDFPSRDRLLQWGVPSPVTVSADPVLGLKLSSTPPATQPSEVGIVLRRLPKTSDFQKLLSMARFLSQRFNAPIHWISFGPSDEHWGRRLAQRTQSPLTPFRLERWEECLSVLAQLKILFTLRYHGAILAWKTGVPSLPLRADPRLLAWFEELHPALHWPKSLPGPQDIWGTEALRQILEGPLLQMPGKDRTQALAERERQNETILADFLDSLHRVK